MSELKAPGKSFAISKQEVWEAWEKVKDNKGAPGADGCSIGDFGADLKDNLYKIWNRMSSGSYFPPPVLAVEIPKPHGGGRGYSACPLSRTESLRRWQPGGWKKRPSRSSIRTPMATGRAGRRWTR